MRPQLDATRDEIAVARLRISALIALGTLGAFFAIGVRYLPPETMRSLLPLTIVQGCVLAGAFAASFTARGARLADVIVRVITVSLAAQLIVNHWIAPQYPSVAATVLAVLLLGSAVFNTWNDRCMAVFALATSAAFAAVVMATPEDAAKPAPPAAAVAALFVAAGAAVTIARLLSRYRGSLAQRERDLASLSARLMSAQEDERRRLSRELHDGLGQSLTATLAYLWAAERQVPPELKPVRAHLQEVRSLIARTLAEVRDLSQLLRPSALDDYGLLPSLEKQVVGFREQHHIETALTTSGLPERLPPEVETTVYRVTQEALTNVARHAQARKVRIVLAAVPGGLELAVEDDGVGFTPPRRAEGLGLIGMRERVRALGGTFEIASDGGTQVRVRLPLG
jgi:two-component system sensor histidine kinase UhpB